MAVALQPATSAIAGTFTPAPARTGTIGAQLQPATSAFTGLFTPAPNRTGTIAATLQNATSSIAGTFSQPASAVFPLQVSGRQIRDKNGNPFFLFGDTPWSLMVGLTDSEVTQYLNDRQTRGVNTLIVNLIEHQFTANPPNTVTGIAPFITPEDIRTPNNVYFDRALGIVQQARSRGMAVLLTPAYLGFGGGSEGWWSALNARNTTECQTYGSYLGTKFAAMDNIIWVMGGDYYASQVLTRTQAIVTGLKATGNANWLFTYHADRTNSSADVVNAETWLNINAIYTDDFTIGSELETGYGVTPTRPMLYFEGYYEGDGGSTGSNYVDFRAQAYMTILTGGMGAYFGNNPIWKFATGWQSALNSQGMQDRQRWATFFKAFNWYNLVPDRNDTVLTSGQGTLNQMAYAARMSDGSKIVVYTPVQKALTIALSQLVGASGTAAWFNPSTGVTTSAGTTGVTGTQTFTPPSSGDWVLTITAVQAAFTPFAVYKFNSGTNGQPCNTEYVAYSSSANPVVYAAGTGPFGETKVGRIQLISAGQASNENYYGGYLRLPAGGIPCAQGQEFWARAFFNLNPLYCAGGKGTAGGAQENVNGFLKFWRWFFDTQYRLTLLAGRDTGSGGLVNGGCGNPSTAPVLGAFNSEITSQNVLSSPQIVIARSTNVPICIYLKFGAPNTANGICRAWINDQLVIQSTAFTNKPPGTFNSIANFTLPGDYYNGLFHDNNYFGDISNIILATSASPPPWTDATGNAYIPSTVNALDY